ncbi:MAG: hypothetical protein ACI85O_003151 [Saprospiraceae bacterium]|jgi:hypothetical protein
MRTITSIFFCLIFLQLQAQTTQNIKGTVLDKDTRQPLLGATVEVMDLEVTKGTTTDIDGKFVIENVPTGRHDIQASYLGYDPTVIEGVALNSAKELFLDINLIESAVMLEGDIVVTAKKRGNEPLNAAALVSTRSFSVEETQRYAASGNDPGRMAMSFPGVQPSRDSRSDIVVRGNSTVGLLWRLEGIDIPNPNHFARRGTSGGGITVFSTSLLGNSDFSTGAFPAEYGNAFSGVMDVKFRNGNKEQREYTFRAGLLGLDFSTEGPIKKGRSSYLINYRYSTLGILNQLGIYLVGERTDNTFQDFSFVLNSSSKNNKHLFKLWGIGGLSRETFNTNGEPEEWETFSDREQYNFTTDMGSVGLAHTWLIDDKSFLKTTIAGMGQRIDVQDDTVTLANIPTQINKEVFTNGRYSLATHYSRKINSQVTMKAGAFVSNLMYDLKWDSTSYVTNIDRQILDVQDNTLLLQPWVQLRYRPNARLSFNAGLHFMYLALNKTSSIEPRLSMRYEVADNQSISLAYGIHGKTVPLGTYYTLVEENGVVTQPNLNLDLIKAHHAILAHDIVFNQSWRLHTELYYQRLFNVPVSPDMNENYWLLNDVQGYASRELVSEGTGRNIGIDMSVEKFFQSGTFFILSGSIFDSKYSPLDDSREFNTNYNSGTAATFIGGKEWQVKEKGTLQLGLKVLYNGGQPITPLLSSGDASNPRNAPLDESNPFSEKVQPYFRPDLRIAYRKDGEKTSWQLALDVQNVANIKNVDGLARRYDPDLNAWVDRIQSLLTPILSYQIDF